MSTLSARDALLDALDALDDEDGELAYMTNMAEIMATSRMASLIIGNMPDSQLSEPGMVVSLGASDRYALVVRPLSFVHLRADALSEDNLKMAGFKKTTLQEYRAQHRLAGDQPMTLAMFDPSDIKLIRRDTLAPVPLRLMRPRFS